MARKKVPAKEMFPGVPRGRQNGAVLDENGAEQFDPEPIVLKVKSGVISDMERIRQAVRSLQLTDASGEEHETWEEADDFEVDDDYGEFSSQHEIRADDEELYQTVEMTLREAKRQQWLAKVKKEREQRFSTPKPVDVPVNGPPPAGDPPAGKP